MTSALTYTYEIDLATMLGGVTRADARKKGVQGFLSVDPLTSSYPMLTPYQFASNTPIQAIDLDGLEAWKAIYDVNEGGETVMELVFDEELEPIGGVYEEYHYLDKEGVQVGGRTSQVSYSAYPDQFPNEGNYYRQDGKAFIEPVLKVDIKFAEFSSNMFAPPGGEGPLKWSVGADGNIASIELKNGSLEISDREDVHDIRLGGEITFGGTGGGFRQELNLGSTDLVGDSKFQLINKVGSVKISNTTNIQTSENSTSFTYGGGKTFGFGYKYKLGVEINPQPSLTKYESTEKNALEEEK